jgi:hypothetical protein
MRCCSCAVPLDGSPPLAFYDTGISDYSATRVNVVVGGAVKIAYQDTSPHWVNWPLPPFRRLVREPPSTRTRAADAPTMTGLPSSTPEWSRETAPLCHLPRMGGGIPAVIRWWRRCKSRTAGPACRGSGAAMAPKVNGKVGKTVRYLRCLRPTDAIVPEYCEPALIFSRCSQGMCARSQII